MIANLISQFAYQMAIIPAATQLFSSSLHIIIFQHLSLRGLRLNLCVIVFGFCYLNFIQSTPLSHIVKTRIGCYNIVVLLWTWREQHPGPWRFCVARLWPKTMPIFCASMQLLRIGRILYILLDIFTYAQALVKQVEKQAEAKEANNNFNKSLNLLHRTRFFGYYTWAIFKTNI